MVMIIVKECWQTATSIMHLNKGEKNYMCMDIISEQHRSILNSFDPGTVDQWQWTWLLGVLVALLRYISIYIYIYRTWLLGVLVALLRYIYI